MITTKVSVKYKPEWLAHEIAVTARHKASEDDFFYVRLIELDEVTRNPTMMNFYIEDTIYKLQQAFKDKGLSYE
jgi:hypothetical protein